MFLRDIKERPNWKKLAEESGFEFHTIDGEPYWVENRMYQFDLKTVEDEIEDPTNELYQLCLDATKKVIDSDELMTKLKIPEAFWGFIRDSFYRGDPTLYSRFDLSFTPGSPAKMLEINADTPTSLYECAAWQWQWLKDKTLSGDLPAHSDQFNILHEHLIERFRMIVDKRREDGLPDLLYVSCVDESEEDRGTVQYLQDVAHLAGIETKFVYIHDIGVDENHGQLLDKECNPIHWIFKLYPWEYLVTEEFAEFILTTDTTFIEPPWKIVMSKGLLPILWEMFEGHRNLLPCYFEDEWDPTIHFGDFVKKPIYSREGANITMISNNQSIQAKSTGEYGEEGFVFQASKPLPKFGNNYALIGSWVVGGLPSGMSIREDGGLITQDSSMFIPHVIM